MHLTLRDRRLLAGVTEKLLSQVERDVTSPSIATVHRVAQALGAVDLAAVRRGHRRPDGWFDATRVAKDLPTRAPAPSMSS